MDRAAVICQAVLSVNRVSAGGITSRIHSGRVKTAPATHRAPETIVYFTKLVRPFFGSSGITVGWLTRSQLTDDVAYDDLPHKTIILGRRVSGALRVQVMHYKEEKRDSVITEVRRDTQPARTTRVQAAISHETTPVHWIAALSSPPSVRLTISLSD